MTSKLIIGLGTGRCGTMSLSYLLNQQPNVVATHEFPPHMPWDVDLELFDERMRQIQSRCDGDIDTAADVSLYYLPYVERIVETYGDRVRFIALKRDRSETVSSYSKKTAGMNHWVEHDGSRWALSGWDKCYPKFDVTDRQDAIGLYWDLYYAECDRLALSLPEQFSIWNMEDLNDKAKVKEILSFADVCFKPIRNVKLNAAR